ncbi:MAG: division/cell wall cluster transcriptional repressor MraZ [Gemmatimonadetes bacterium]|nr:division/cell wall cluster transcriptional repressor MraZ [Gemmatimonadota bacterium]
MSKRQPKLRNQILGLTANAIEVVPDKQGRILIPEKMRKAVSLDSEAMVVGAINHIEFWDPEKFDKTTSQTDEDFDRHIESVFA